MKTKSKKSKGKIGRPKVDPNAKAKPGSRRATPLFTFACPLPLKRELQALALRTGQDMSELAREAIAEKVGMASTEDR